MSAKKTKLAETSTHSEPSFAAFDQLDGSHPWQEATKESYILYPARKLKGGRVCWFNFELAQEMGLLEPGTSPVLSRALEKKLLDTFCLRIINEYDQTNKIHFGPSEVKPNPYMATRYLQLQHPDKKGRTSGDGRCIWNGVVSHKGTTWDVSSRGTGVTALAPGAVRSKTPLQSGNTDHGYGCGLAEIDELYSSAILAEIMHRNGFHTERMLAIIDIGNECAIGVRAGKNLFRPAHLFLHLKQENYDELKRATDFLIDRQFNNKEWSFHSRTQNCYELLLDQLSESFAQFAARLEREYVFAWLDWDGDNVLATAGIIDYGSVRLFGARHDQYRYDDEDRYSTNLNEQKSKAQLTVQVFAQMVDYLQTKKKRPLQEFCDHPSVTRFGDAFKSHLIDHFLYQVGFPDLVRKRLLAHSRPRVERFYNVFRKLEQRKTRRRATRVADGVNRPAIFNMRHFLRDFPTRLPQRSSNHSSGLLTSKQFCEAYKTQYASRADVKPTTHLDRQIRLLQSHYIETLKLAAPNRQQQLVQKLVGRASVIHRMDRITGNALINMVSEILSRRQKGVSDQQIMLILDRFVQSQVARPERIDLETRQKLDRALMRNSLGRTLLALADDYKEDI